MFDGRYAGSYYKDEREILMGPGLNLKVLYIQSVTETYEDGSTNTLFFYIVEQEETSMERKTFRIIDTKPIFKKLFDNNVEYDYIIVGSLLLDKQKMNHYKIIYDRLLLDGITHITQNPNDVDGYFTDFYLDTIKWEKSPIKIKGNLGDLYNHKIVPSVTVTDKMSGLETEHKNIKASKLENYIISCCLTCWKDKNNREYKISYTKL